MIVSSTQFAEKYHTEAGCRMDTIAEIAEAQGGWHSSHSVQCFYYQQH